MYVMHIGPGVYVIFFIKLYKMSHWIHLCFTGFKVDTSIFFAINLCHWFVYAYKQVSDKSLLYDIILMYKQLL